MKKYLPLLGIVLIFIIGGCTKQQVTDSITVIPGVSIGSVDIPTFANSSWINVTGGTVMLQFNELNDQDTVISRSVDSTDFANLSAYTRVLNKGLYDIFISSKNQTALADTFIRFNAEVRSYSVDHKQQLALAATTADGLITIGQSFIQDGTEPVFKTDSGASVAYKMGLSNGFYYLYVRGGVKGNVEFNAKVNGQLVTKHLSMVTLNQYNIEVVANKGPLKVIFTRFIYNQVAVSSSTLATINVSLDNYNFHNGKNIYFVATDADGNVLNEIKYLRGAKTFKLNALQPYEKDRFNMYVIITPDDPAINPTITGYLQVKKGSIYNSIYSVLPQEARTVIKPHLKNTNGFDYLLIGSNINGDIIQSLADTAKLTTITSSNDMPKLYLLMLKNNKYTYNFFDIPKGSTDINIDMSKVNKIPLMKTITAPGPLFSLQVYGKVNAAYFDAGLLSTSSTRTNSIDVYYPKEKFQEYDTYATYSISDLQYDVVTAGTAIPDEVAPFNASFNVSGSTMADFVPSFSGKFDYYHASFQNKATFPVYVDLYSPALANFTHIKYPDFGKYLDAGAFNLSAQRLYQFQLVQYQGFDEKLINYKPEHAIRSAPDFNSKAVTGYFNR